MASAETKRQSVGNKIATPKTQSSAPPPAQGLADVDQALAKAIGARVTINLTSPPNYTLSGVLFAADRLTNILVVSATINSAQQPDFHFIHTSKIVGFQVNSLETGGAKSFADITPSIGPVDLQEAARREDQAVAQEKEREQRRKRGVTAEAEELFVALARMYPTHWAEEKMVINENVVIHPPFRPENCQAQKGNETSLARIRKTVENVWLKHADKTSSRTGTPQPPRKGG